LSISFINPPETLLSSGTKKGVELGGVKSIISLSINEKDGKQVLITEGNIFTELSWAEFYQEKGLEDQIDTFTTTKFDSVREEPKALVNTIVESINNIINNKRLFYGIADFEVDAFMNRNCVMPGLKLDMKIINKLMEAHKKSRDENLFPKIYTDKDEIKKINLEFQGKKKSLYFHGSKLEDISEKLSMAKGFATGIVCTSKGAANLYIMSDNILFKEGDVSELHVDQENIMIIEMGIQRQLLFPLCWFRIDIGIKSLETLELWEEIKNDSNLIEAFKNYESYVNELLFEKYKMIASGAQIGTNLEEEFYNMTPEEKKKALKDMADAIKTLTKKYKE